jgi:HK97 family phage major capsid protein
MPQRSLGEIKAEQTQLRTRVGQLVDEAREIEIKMSVDGATDGLEERKANIERGKAKASARLQELGAEYNAEVTRRYEAGAFSVETGTNFDNAYTERETRTNDASAIEPHRKQALDGALRCLERTQHSGVMSDRAATAMEGVVRHGDPSGSTARYLAAVADPAYFTAFGKLLQYGSNAGMRMSSEEHRAVERVTAIDEERSMMDGIGASGGFAIPIEIDPTILLSSSGVLNPVRQVARVVPMASSTLRLVSSTGVTASYGPEGAEQTDGSPTLVQPTLTAQRGSAFVPFSIEIGQDWPLLAQELAKLFADERDVLDSLKFLSGTGIAEPQGILATGGLTSTQEITTATGSTTAIADLYSLREGLANTRFFPRASWLAHPTVFDKLFRFVGGGNTAEPEPFTQGRGGPILGTPKYEYSSMQYGTTTSGNQISILGDFSGYVIGDRIGSQIELIPMLMGPTNRYPTGQRGLFYWWRTGTAVSIPNAFRYLQVQ